MNSIIIYVMKKMNEILLIITNENSEGKLKENNHDSLILENNKNLP